MRIARLIRDTFRISQQEVCEAAGVSRVSMVAYDSGTAFPSRATCKRIDDAIMGIVEQRTMESIKSTIAARIEHLPDGYAPDPNAGLPPGPEIQEAAAGEG
jgi:predicted transcriptional regulator